MDLTNMSLGTAIGTLNFPCTDDMVKDKNVKYKMIVCTFGYHKMNDCPMILYSIEEYRPDIFMDNGNYIKLTGNPNLMAVRIHNEAEPTNVKHYGAYGDGSHDDSTAIQNCLNANDMVVFGNRETYRVTKQINVNKRNNKIDLNGSTILASGNNYSVFAIDQKETMFNLGISKTYNDRDCIEIKNGEINLKSCNNAGIGIKVANAATRIDIKNVLLTLKTNKGIYITADTFAGVDLEDDYSVIGMEKLRINIQHCNITNDIGKTATMTDKTSIGIQVDAPCTTIDNTSIVNCYVGILNNYPDTVIENNRINYWGPVNLTSGFNSIAIKNTVKNLVCRHNRVRNYWTALWASINTKFISVDDLKVSYNNYFLGEAYVLYFDGKVVDAEGQCVGLSVILNNIMATAGIDGSYKVTNTSLPLGVIQSVASVYDGFTNAPMDWTVYNVLNRRESEVGNTGVNNHSPNTMKIGESIIGNVIVKPKNTITNIANSGVTYAAGVGSGDTKVDAQSSETAGKIVSQKGKKGEYVKIYFQVSSGFNIHDCFFASFLVNNPSGNVKFYAYVYPTESGSDEIATVTPDALLKKGHIYSEEIPYADSTRRHFFFTCDVPNANLTSQDLNKKCVYLLFLFYQETDCVFKGPTSSGGTQDKDNGFVLEVTKPYVAKMNDGTAVRMYGETLKSLAKSVYERIADTFGNTGNPDASKSGTPSGSTTLKLMSVPWISHIVPYYMDGLWHTNQSYTDTNKLKPVELGGSYPFIDNALYNKYLDIIPQPNGFSVIRNVEAENDYRATMEDFRITLLKVIDFNFASSRTFYFNANISTNHDNEAEGRLQVYIDKKLAADYSYKEKAKKSIVITKGQHTIEFAIKYSDKSTVAGLIMNVTNFFVTESPVEEIFEMPVTYDKYYRMPLYKNGFVVATLQNPIPVTVGNPNPYLQAPLYYTSGRGQIEVWFKD